MVQRKLNNHLIRSGSSYCSNTLISLENPKIKLLSPTSVCVYCQFKMNQSPLNYEVVTFNNFTNSKSKPIGDLVPSSWIEKHDGSIVCFYPQPPYKNIKEMVKTGTHPAFTWQTYDIECHGNADSYTKGLKKLDKFVKKLSTATTTEDDQHTRRKNPVPALDDVPEFPSEVCAGSSQIPGALVSVKYYFKIQDLTSAIGLSLSNARDWEGGRLDRGLKTKPTDNEQTQRRSPDAGGAEENVAL